MDMSQKIEISKQYFGSLKDSIEHNQEHGYKVMAKNYDEVMIGTGYHVAIRVGEMCVKYISDKSENAQILDIASGTGLVTQTMFKEGFKGKADGIDGSKEMIEQSIKKNLYRDIQHRLITEENPLPYPDNTYDGAVCAGGLSFGHIPHPCLYDMMRILKPGGILIFNMIKLENDPTDKVMSSIRNIVNKMADDGLCEIVEAYTSTDVHCYDDSETTIYCLRKLPQK